MSRLLVWDLPTRLFHWLFAVAFVAAYILEGDDDQLGWHSYMGYLVFGLVIFRLVWGYVGGSYSRFSSFPINLATAWRYLKDLRAGTGEHFIGHNPAGAIAIYALLALGLLTAISGMALLGADRNIGPMAGVFSATSEHTIKEIHEFFSNAMLLVVLVHIGGVVIGSLRHRENLPRAMVTGYKATTQRESEIGPVKPGRIIAAAMLVGIAAFTATHDFSAGCDANPAVCDEEGEHHEHEEHENEADDDD